MTSRLSSAWVESRVTVFGFFDGLVMQFLDKDAKWNLGSGWSKFGENVGANIVVAYNLMNLQTGKFVFQFAYLSDVVINSYVVDVSLLVDLLDD